MKLRGVEGYFCDVRIERDTVPEYFHFWELADEDSNGIPCRYKNGILVNFYGTFLTTGELPIDNPTWEEGYICSKEEWVFIRESISFKEMETLERRKLVSKS